MTYDLSRQVTNRLVPTLLKSWAVAFALLALAPTARAAGDDGQLDAVHHTANGYYLDFAPIGKVELPRIFLIRNAEGNWGLDAFWSTAAALRSGRYTLELHGIEDPHAVAAAPHAEAAVDSAMVHGDHITVHGDETMDQQAIFDLIEDGQHLDATLLPGAGSIVLDLSISRHLVFALIAALLVFLIFTSLARRYKRGIGRKSAPKGTLQNLLEVLIVYLRDNVAKPALGHHYTRFMPYLLTVFFFVLFCNLLGLVPYGATATANISVTAALALFTFFVTQFSASRDYWQHVFWPPGIPAVLKPLMIPVEILGMFTKPFALAVRLFANMTAGHLVILNLIGLIFIFGSKFGAAGGYGVSVISVAMTLFIYALELLVALIQAYVFTMLSAIFIGMAVQSHHDHHGEFEGHLPGHDDHVPGTFSSGKTAGILAQEGKPHPAKVEPVAV